MADDGALAAAVCAPLQRRHMQHLTHLHSRIRRRVTLLGGRSAGTAPAHAVPGLLGSQLSLKTNWDMYRLCRSRLQALLPTHATHLLSGN